VTIDLALHHQKLVLSYDILIRHVTVFFLPPARLSTSVLHHICLYLPAAQRHSFFVPPRVEGRVSPVTNRSRLPDCIRSVLTGSRY